MPSSILCMHLMKIEGFQKAPVSGFGFLHVYILPVSNKQHASQHSTVTKNVPPQHSANVTQIKLRGKTQDTKNLQ